MAAVNNLTDRASQISTTNNLDVESLMSLLGGPRIQISNEPELRLEMRELDEEGEEWRFLDYAEEDRGVLESG